MDSELIELLAVAVPHHGICPHGYYCGLRRLGAPANIYYIIYCMDGWSHI